MNKKNIIKYLIKLKDRTKENTKWGTVQYYKRVMANTILEKPYYEYILCENWECKLKSWKNDRSMSKNVNIAAEDILKITKY